MRYDPDITPRSRSEQSRTEQRPGSSLRAEQSRELGEEKTAAAKGYTFICFILAKAIYFCALLHAPLLSSDSVREVKCKLFAERIAIFQLINSNILRLPSHLILRIHVQNVVFANHKRYGNFGGCTCSGRDTHELKRPKDLVLRGLV